VKQRSLHRRLMDSMFWGCKLGAACLLSSPVFHAACHQVACNRSHRASGGFGV
jgi:hypothetical protein